MMLLQLYILVHTHGPVIIGRLGVVGSTNRRLIVISHLIGAQATRADLSTLNPCMFYLSSGAPSMCWWLFCKYLFCFVTFFLSGLVFFSSMPHLWHTLIGNYCSFVYLLTGPLNVQVRGELRKETLQLASELYILFV
jgi:hypothetical protein